jgi:hypothetical protein
MAYIDNELNNDHNNDHIQLINEPNNDLNDHNNNNNNNNRNHLTYNLYRVTLSLMVASIFLWYCCVCIRSS